MSGNDGCSFTDSAPVTSPDGSIANGASLTQTDVIKTQKHTFHVPS
jgi:hypothetical protein